MKFDPVAPTWLMSLRAHPEVQVIGKVVTGLKGQNVNWRHSMVWCLALFEYEAEFVIDEHVVPIHPGALTIFPPGALCSAHFIGRNEHIHALFQLAAGRGDEVPIPCLTDLGHEAGRIQSQLEVALASYPTEPALTARILYDILHELSVKQASPRPTTRLHPAVRAAVAYIETNLHGQIDVKTTAAHTDLSERQLRTHFQREFNTTVVGYIRRRRAERAAKLLLATDLPAKEIAAQIGILDLQQFNKLIRREHGLSPHALRASKQLTG